MCYHKINDSEHKDENFLTCTHIYYNDIRVIITPHNSIARNKKEALSIAFSTKKAVAGSRVINIVFLGQTDWLDAPL